jgi:hypothetical protein
MTERKSRGKELQGKMQGRKDERPKNEWTEGRKIGKDWKDRKGMAVGTALAGGGEGGGGCKMAAIGKAVRQAGRMCGSGHSKGSPHGNRPKGIELAFLFLTAQFIKNLNLRR